MKNRFSRWLSWRPSWISNRNHFSQFQSISQPDASYQVSSQLAFGFRRRSEKKISRWPPWRPPWIPNSMILATFDLQVTLMRPTKFGVNRPSGSGEEEKNRFSRWRSWRPSWISDWNDFSYTPRCFLPSFESTGIWS